MDIGELNKNITPEVAPRGEFQNQNPDTTQVSTEYEIAPIVYDEDKTRMLASLLDLVHKSKSPNYKSQLLN